jgi:hypothetical protein
MYCGVPCTRSLFCPLIQAVPKSRILTAPGARQHDVHRLQVAVIDPLAVHVHQRIGHADEDQDPLAQRGVLQRVEDPAVDVLHQEVDARDAQPLAVGPAVVDLQQARVIEPLRHLELVQGLGDVDVVAGVLPLDDLHRERLARPLLPDQQDRAAGAGTQRLDHLVFHLRQLRRA